MEQIQTQQGNYTFKAIPTNKKTWRETDQVEVVFLLETDKETKSFKGVLDLFGIVKK